MVGIWNSYLEYVKHKYLPQDSFPGYILTFKFVLEKQDHAIMLISYIKCNNI